MPDQVYPFRKIKHNKFNTIATYKKMITLNLKKTFAVLALYFVASTISAQHVTGVVLDDIGAPLPGVTIMVQGTQNGTVTSGDGSFNMKVSNTKKDVLVFSFIGMKTQEVPVEGKSRINVIMQANTIMMDEHVVIGYGTTKRRDLTGSVASVNAETLEKIPTGNIAGALTGRLTGVQVTTTDGAPDAEIKINVRGGTSITQDNSPLYIVDGFPVSSISDLSPSNIASIDVLKDASSTAIYGSRGSNGVIIITTKSPQTGKFNIQYNGYYGQSKAVKGIQVLKPYEYALWQYEQAVYRKSVSSMYEPYFGTFDDIELYQNARGNDWKSIVLGQTGHVMNHNIVLSGSSDNLRYSANIAHQYDKGVMIGSDYRRTNFSLKLNHKITKKISIDMQSRYYDMQISGSGMNEQSGGRSSDPRMKYVMQYSPIPLKNISLDDDFNEEDFYNNSGLFTPTQYIADNERFQFRKGLNIQGGINWEMFENLKFKTSFSSDNQWLEDQRFFGTTTYYSRRTSSIQGKPAIGIINRTMNKIINSNTLEYNFKKQLPGQHQLTLLLGQEMIMENEKILTLNVDGLPESFDAEKAFKFTSQGTPVGTDNFHATPDHLLSFFGRANYSLLNGKYLFTTTLRADGSSKFMGSNRWGYFPSVAAGWRLSEENFLNGIEWLQNLKFRISYGLAGNNNIPTGQTRTELTSSNTSMLPFTTSYWSTGSIMTNEELKWETTTTRNVGLDFGFLNGRINGNIDAYFNTTDDLLIRFPIKGAGYAYQYRNIGSTQNKGIEFLLNAIAFDRPNFGLDLSFNISINKNKVTSLGGLDQITAYSSWASTEIDYDYIVQVGQPLGQIYGYVNDGRYAATDFTLQGDTWIANEGVIDNSYLAGVGWGPGAVKLKDLDENGKIEATGDRKVLGSTLPLALGGFSINTRFYGFDINANFNYTYGNKILNVDKALYTSTGKYRYLNLLTSMDSEHRWRSIDEQGNRITDVNSLTEINQNTTMWSPATGYRFVSSWMVEDGSFVRFSNLTIGYTLNKSLTKKLNIKSLRLYLTGTNIFCLTKYSGSDPEVDTRRATPLTPGVDYSAYPKTRGLIVGINLNI